MVNNLKAVKYKRILFSLGVFAALLVWQVLSGKIGTYISRIVSYEQIDPYNAFIGISIHHIVMMILSLLIIAILSRNFEIDFNFKLGDVKKGTKILAVFTAVYALISIILHIGMLANNQLPVYDFPLNGRNIIGTLTFQLLLTGTAEEIVYRALPIPILIHAFGKSVSIYEDITLEVVLAAVLFSFAHVKLTLIPFDMEANYYQLLYSFMMGMIQGIVYQKTKSVLYPMLMHSFSNVLSVGTGYFFILVVTKII
jgi:membrane protease YdiL (CAAX protease family)